MASGKTSKPRKGASDSRSAAKPPADARYRIVSGAARGVAEPGPSYVAPSSASVVSATEAARRFSDLINRASYQGETFVIERGGRQLCQLGPLQARRCTGSELLALLERLPRPDDEFLAAVESATLSQGRVEASPWDK